MRISKRVILDLSSTPTKSTSIYLAPESFRTILWQIAKESNENFAKAHKNLENILLLQRVKYLATQEIA
jgi:hypothetical protein